ncbi:MAG TPA: UbiX family flavin prenyltransferase [Thermoplasmata archaeon]|nr:UbiX family flavin prenyltransferase [Thermoplasmata archaeon]
MGENRPIVVAVSGASGAPIAVRLLEWLRKARVPAALVVSAGGRKVVEAETDIDIARLSKLAARTYADDDLAAPIASGTQPTRGMVVVPCSSNTVARLALGLGDSLIARAAHVHLKEGRRLVVVPRETPLPTVMLRHLTTLSELGVVVLVASPAFYLKPRTIEDVTDYLVGKILDQFGLRHRLYRPWGSDSG